MCFLFKVLGQLGRVFKIDSRGDVHVSFNESGLMFCFNPLALSPFTSDESSSSAFGGEHTIIILLNHDTACNY